MAEKKKRGCLLPLILAIFVLGGLASCCGCAGLWYALPGMLAHAFTEEGALKAPVVDPDSSVAPRIERALETTGTLRVNGVELVQVVEPWEEEELYAFWVEVHPDDSVELALSVYIEDLDRFINLQTRGSCEIEHGWFTDFTVDEVEVSGWDLGQYMRGQQLAEHANRSVADQRSQDPQVGQFMDQIDHLWIADGTINLELVPGGWEVWQGME
jgi:hypothetical protein